MIVKKIHDSWTVKVSIIIDVAARDLVSEVVREVLSH
jgi:hypothetical protein